MFGRGGVFGALRRKSQRVVDTYELASKMGDLHLGDAHLIEDIADESPTTFLEQDMYSLITYIFRFVLVFSLK